MKPNHELSSWSYNDEELVRCITDKTLCEPDQPCECCLVDTAESADG